MTLAVGLIGSDGWVLASDKRLYESSGNLQPEVNKIITGTMLSRTPKIHWVPEADLIYTFAGDHVSMLAGEALADKLKKNACSPSARGTFLNEVGNLFWSNHARLTTQPSLKRDLLVIFTKPSVQLWTVGLGLTSTPGLHEDIALIGDTSNGAKIFPLLYYSPRSVEELKVLAAHTILLGHQCAKSLVEGLEMWVGTPDAEQIQPSELRELEKRSAKIDKATRRLFSH